MADKFQSIFDDNVEAEKQFDTMFGADEDDKLIEAVLSVNEGNLPDFEELHQTDDEAKPKDLADELGPNHDENKPTADSSNQEIIADDDDEILDLACPKCGVQDAVQKKEPDNTDITDEIEKSETKLTNESLQSLLDEADTDLGDNEGLGEPGDLGDADGVANDTSDTEELTDNEDKNENEEMKDPVGESTSLVDQLLAECDDPECSVDGEYTDPEDGQGKPDVNNNAKTGAEGTDKDPVYESDTEDCKDTSADDVDADDDDSVEESTSLVDALLEEADEDLPEEVEDEIIADATDDAEMSDAEVDAIDDIYDDDILDDLDGEE